jgi:hypothetical protein
MSDPDGFFDTNRCADCELLLNYEPLLFVARVNEPDYKGEVLITVYKEGDATIAFRSNPAASWGPPTGMERRDENARYRRQS